MKIENICPEYRIRPWKPQKKLVPHLTIETNMTCNFRCRSCYNENTGYVKDISQVYREIDSGLKLRKVDTMTIMGGEPTLYPELANVISYIKSKGIFCQMLTNGFLLLNDEKDLLLKELVAAGLDRIILHVDKGQEAYPDPFAALHALFKKTGKSGLLTSVSWTIYRDNQRFLPEIIHEFSGYRNFDGMLALLEKPMDECILPGFRRELYPNMAEEHEALESRLGLHPSIYLPNSYNDHEVSWLVYMYFINVSTFETFYLSPTLTRLFQKTYTAIFKKEMFGKPPMRSSFTLSLFVTALLEIMLNPKRTGKFIRFMKKSAGAGNIRFHYIAIQDSPSYNPETKNVAICYGCPDATVRNGKLTPVCLADRINPLSESKSVKEVFHNLGLYIFEHLEQQ